MAVLRDAVGRLTLVVLDPSKTGTDRSNLSLILNARLEGYSDRSGISVATPDELFDNSLSDSVNGFRIPVQTVKFNGSIRLVDRRVVGSDWLQRPASIHAKAPRLFFVSLKGGVGRSTALCVLASHLANQGYRVLAIDLDLEAPGLGTMLLDHATLPNYGVLDYLVESNLSEIGNSFFTDLVSPSPLTQGRGIVSVIPALGRMSHEFPENVLAKIARAYLPSEIGDETRGLTAKIEHLIETLTATGEHDIVLVDARAGLHESTAASAVGLQGDTLLFGMDQPQTYSGYRALFAQLRITLGDSWPNRIHLVEARVGADGPSLDFMSSMTSIMSSEPLPSYRRGIPLASLRDVFDVDWEESTSTADLESVPLHQEGSGTHIFESDIFSKFDPLRNPDRLDHGVYAAVFGDFLEKCMEIIKSAEQVNGAPND